MEQHGDFYSLALLVSTFQSLNLLWNGVLWKGETSVEEMFWDRSSMVSGACLRSQSLLPPWPPLVQCGMVRNEVALTIFCPIITIHEWKGDCWAYYPATLVLKSLGVHRDGKASRVTRLRNEQPVFIEKRPKTLDAQQPKHWMIKPMSDDQIFHGKTHRFSVQNRTRTALVATPKRPRNLPVIPRTRCG